MLWSSSIQSLIDKKGFHGQKFLISGFGKDLGITHWYFVGTYDFQHFIKGNIAVIIRIDRKKDLVLGLSIFVVEHCPKFFSTNIT